MTCFFKNLIFSFLFSVEDIIVNGVDLMQEVSSAIETLLLVICTSDTTGENLKPLMVWLLLYKFKTFYNFYLIFEGLRNHL